MKLVLGKTATWDSCVFLLAMCFTFLANVCCVVEKCIQCVYVTCIFIKLCIFCIGAASYVHFIYVYYIFFFKKINLFIYLRLRWVFVAARGLSLVVVSGVYSSLRCVGFSWQWHLLLWSTGCRCASFNSCGTRAH